MDHQRSKISFPDFRWIGPLVIEKLLLNDIYVVRPINTNKGQLLHRVRLRQYNSDIPLDDSYQNEKLKLDKNIRIPQDDLYTIARETEFEPIFDNPIPYQDPNGIDWSGLIE